MDGYQVNGLKHFRWRIRLVLFITFYIHTYHSRFIPEGVADCTSQIFFRDNHVLPKWLFAMRNAADVTGGKSIAVWSQYISSVKAVNPLVAFPVKELWAMQIK
jgi:hypothetical protein